MTGAVGVLFLSISTGVRAADTPCDRACLNGFVDQYLAALVARDPSKLPLTKTARYTENGQTLKLGDGMWGPVITIGNTRDELVTVANSYFEGLEKATNKYTPFDKNCKRIENGVVTSNDPASKNPITRMSCGDQFATGFSKIITRVQDRRFPMVDEERGLVFTVIRFDHSGKNKTTVWNDGSTHPVNTPFAFEIGELFKTRNGKIQQIEALVSNVPYCMPTGWGRKE
jgi:hypothetical protein